MMLMLLAACGLHSNLYIESGAAFELGENRHEAFRATVSNEGQDIVRVVARSGDQALEVGLLNPGDEASLRFERGETAVFENQGNGTAHLDVRVRGDTDLSMGYSPQT